MDENNTSSPENGFTDQDWAEMESARKCAGKDDGCEGCSFCDPLPEYTAAENHRAAVNYQMRVMARGLGVRYLNPKVVASMWEHVPDLESIVLDGHLHMFTVMLREHSSRINPWGSMSSWVPDSIVRVREAQARAAREGGSR